MRVLFLNSAFPGRFGALAQAFGASAENTVLFLAESGQKTALPGVRRLRLAPPKAHESHDPAEVEIVTRLRRGARAGNALLSLRRDGFMPDLIYASASMGGSLYVRDIFPEAFYVVHGDWFYTRGESHCFFTRGHARPPADFAPLRVSNLWEYNALGECDLAVTYSQWQRAQYPAGIARDMQVIHGGINTRYFAPGDERRAAGEGQELVSFCAPLHESARGFAQFRQCLPRLLEMRPRCQVALAWLDTAGSDAGKTPAQRAQDLPGLDAAHRARVHLLGARSLGEYRAVLQASSVHVYLAAPHVLSTGLWEAMACGALVLGSDTPPVREVLQHGVNGFLCDFWDHQHMAEVLAGMLERAPRLEHVRRNARQSILEGYDARVQTRRFMDLILERMRARSAVPV